jgi:hypothetical protein
MKIYKVLASDGVSPHHGGSGKWFVPKGKRPGKWMPVIKDIQPCERGYHFVNLEQLPTWSGPTLYEVEVRGQVIHRADKSVAEQARLIRKVETWNEKTLRLFAADCAEHVLGIYERVYPKDDRPRKAIQTARDFANGLIDRDAIVNAANAYADAHAAYAAAAYAANAYADAHAAYAAAAYAAYADAHAAHAAYAAAHAAYAAAHAAYAAAPAAYAAAHAAAAYAAAHAAAYAAAHAAEKEWQFKRLKHYLGVA